MDAYPVIDADGHVRESIPGIREFLEPRWQRRNLFPTDAWDRDLRGKLGQAPQGPKTSSPRWTRTASTSWCSTRRPAWRRPGARARLRHRR